MTQTTTAPASETTAGPLGNLPFCKYHGLGNDFILVDNRASTEPLLTPAQSQAACDRHEGIGGDGVIFLLPAEQTDFAMRIYNSDGSEPEMCGNGIRCLARFARDLGIDGDSYRIDTLAGVMETSFESNGSSVRVNMGPPVTSPPESIPTTLQQGDILTVQGKQYEMHCVSMGNPHAVTFLQDQSSFNDIDAQLEHLGPMFEANQVFPQKVNTEFVLEKSSNLYQMVVWERGAGRTRACGTGACAIAVAAIETGRAKKDTPITIQLPGGDLIIEWVSTTNDIMMTGPAEFVFNGYLQE